MAFAFKKFVKLLDRSTLDTDATATYTTAALDTLGAQSAAIVINLGTIAASANLTVCKVQSCSTSGGVYADVTGLAMSTAQGLTVDDSEAQKIISFQWDLINGADRFYKLIITTGTGNALVVDAITGILSDLRMQPPAAADVAFLSFVK